MMVKMAAQARAHSLMCIQTHCDICARARADHGGGGGGCNRRHEPRGHGRGAEACGGQRQHRGGAARHGVTGPAARIPHAAAAATGDADRLPARGALAVRSVGLHAHTAAACRTSVHICVVCVCVCVRM